MQEPARWHTLKGLADSPETRPLYDKLVDKNGRVRIHKDVRVVKEIGGRDEDGKPFTSISSSPLPRGFGGLVLGKDKAGGSYGPELGFGVALHETLQEPILIIKTAWGGKNLHSQFRPPTGKEWTPPKGHPDHPDSAPSPLPIPTSIKLPDDFKPPAGHGNHIQIAKGFPVGEVNGVHPIYVSDVYEKKGKLTSIPLEKGDLIIGLNGRGLRENPVRRWRDLWFNEVRDGDWKLKMGNPDELKGKERGRLVKKIRVGIIEIVRTPEETEYLKNNVSNQGYHYHGSPKFFVRAGAAFAEALSDMIKRGSGISPKRALGCGLIFVGECR